MRLLAQEAMQLPDRGLELLDLGDWVDVAPGVQAVELKPGLITT